MKFTDSEIAAGWRIENGHLVRPLNEAVAHLRQHIKTLEERLRCPGHIDGHYCQHCEATIESPL